MGFFYWLRTAIMILAFAGTVFLIREINQPVSPGRDRLYAFLGSPPDPTVAIVNLCPTRITKFSLPDGVEILQRGLDWTRVHAGTESKLDQVAVEKWFSAYCTFAAKKVSPAADVKTILTLEFVSGPVRALIRSAAGEFEWDGQPFASDKMTEALGALDAFPAAPPR